MKNIIYVLVLLVITTLQSCVSIVMLSSAYPAKAEDALIEVFVTNKPSKEYIEIALIKYDSEWTEEATLNTIKAKARKMGADALIITGRVGSSGVVYTTGNVAFVSTETSGFAAVAIKYKE